MIRRIAKALLLGAAAAIAVFVVAPPARSGDDMIGLWGAIIGVGVLVALATAISN